MFSSSLVGHEIIRKKLWERLSMGKLSGSLLFVGPEAVGKRRVAMELAQRELCFRKNACGKCEGCKPFQEDPLPVELPHFLRIAPEGKAGLIKIGAIRDDDLVPGGVIAWASLAPPPGCRRWILIEDAHRLNGSSANILLKTLEEPPRDCHFILVTHRPEAVLQTIRSRCERISFSPLPLEELWSVAQQKGWSQIDRLGWLALSQGTLRLIEEDAYQRVCAQIDAWLKLMEGAPFDEVADPLFPDKDADLAVSEQLRLAFEWLLQILNDLTRMREGAKPMLEVWKGRLEALLAKHIDLRVTQNTLFDVLKNLNRNLTAEFVLREVTLALEAG